MILAGWLSLPGGGAAQFIYGAAVKVRAPDTRALAAAVLELECLLQVPLAVVGPAGVDGSGDLVADVETAVEARPCRLDPTHSAFVDPASTGDNTTEDPELPMGTPEPGSNG